MERRGDSGILISPIRCAGTRLVGHPPRGCPVCLVADRERANDPVRAGINAEEGPPVETQTFVEGAADEREHLTQIQGAADETADGLQPLQVEQLAYRVSGVPSENRRIHDGLILVALRPGD